MQQQLADSAIWQDIQKAGELQKQLGALDRVLQPIDAACLKLHDLLDMHALCVEEGDEAFQADFLNDVQALVASVDALEFTRMFSQPMDSKNAYVEIQSGSGGTEAQDWAEMLFRMYSRWAEKKDFSVEILDHSEGEVAGIKGATLKIAGQYAFGWLRTETGIHRLVRKSPFDSGNRRHTSFAAVFVSPEIDDTIEVEINPQDLRIDTYRSSGAGGQHVNTTDSAVRITHVPTQLVVQCQSERSQHQNKHKAMQQLRAKMYAYLRQKQEAESQAQSQAKDDITWGHQIRSYVLDQSRIKDLRTGYETGNTQAVLDGDLDGFMATSLKQGIGTNTQTKD